MGRSPSITVGDTSRGARVEHVTSRGVIRLVRWTAGKVDDDAVGLEVSDFCARLELTTDVVGPARRYLLVAGAERPGAGHIVALFATEAEARVAFVRYRRSEPGREAWAEVTELTTDGTLRRVCWFGTAAREMPPGTSQSVEKRPRLVRRVLSGSARRRLPAETIASHRRDSQ